MNNVGMVGAGISHLETSTAVPRSDVRPQRERDQVRTQGTDVVKATGDAGDKNAGSKDLDRAALESAIKELNKSLNGVTSLRFSVDKESDQVVVRVVDPSSDKVIRQIPDEKMMEMAKRMNDLKGILFDKSA